MGWQWFLGLKQSEHHNPLLTEYVPVCCSGVQWNFEPDFSLPTGVSQKSPEFEIGGVNWCDSQLFMLPPNTTRVHERMYTFLSISSCRQLWAYPSGELATSSSNLGIFLFVPGWMMDGYRSVKYGVCVQSSVPEMAPITKSE